MACVPVDSGGITDGEPDTSRWARICAIFDMAADRPVDEWDAIITRESGDDTSLRDEVLGILAAEREDRFRLEQPRFRLEDADGAQEGIERVGQIVARYRLVRLIGHGGMGSVYEGVRADDEYEQRVAVKLIRPQLAAAGMASRFRHERQILAALEHRNIARLLDGGGTEHGEPFFVMEYVEGMPITAYCNEHRLSIADRLRLFLQACSAVQHAHGKLVVHRDLKPANILVAADGSVKLLDFGIAKLLGAQDGGDADSMDTATHGIARALTPEYASPEQLRDEPASVASDVYSLGVILYELLAGRRPFVGAGRSLLASLNTAEAGAPSPSTVVTPDAAIRMSEPNVARLRRSLAGELDSIVRTAIRPAASERYASVETFADDLRRYLDGVPVTAHPDSALYRARKFVRRHRGSVLTASVAVAALIGGTIATATQARRADTQARRAEVERTKVARINTFLQDMLSAPDTRWIASGTRHASQTTVSQVLDDAARRAGVDLATEPQVESAVRQTLGRTYTAIGRYSAAATQLERALAIDRGTHAPVIPIVVTDVHDLGMARFRLGDNYAADTLFRAALRLCDANDQAADTAHVCGQTINDLGLATMFENELPESERLFRTALDMAKRILGPFHPAVAVVLGNLGLVRDSRGDLTGAEQYYRQALAVFARSSREFPERTYALENLASLLAMEGRLSEAEPLVQQAIEIGTRTEGPSHPDVGFGWVNLGAIHRDMGKLALARTEMTRGLKILAEAGPGARHYYVRVHTEDARLMIASGKPKEAIPVLRALLDSVVKEYKPDDYRAAEVREALGEALVASGRRATALPLLAASYAAFLNDFGATHPETVAAKQRLDEVKGTGVRG